jgi:hypothetical protein
MSDTIALNETKQNILLRNLKKITEFFKDSTYKNFITLNITDPELTISKLTGLPPNLAKRYLQMTPQERMFLLPRIEIARLDRDSNVYPIYFKNNFDDKYIKFLTEGTIVKTIMEEDIPPSGCGISKITLEDRPENLADVNITCTIDLHFENVAALLQKNILELIKVPAKKDNKDYLDYRLKMILSWNFPEDYEKLPILDDEFKEAIKKFKRTYLLELVHHTLSFGEDGTVKLSISYQAGIDGYFQSNQADLFNTDNLQSIYKYAFDMKKIKDKIEALVLQNERLSKNINDSSKDKIEENTEEISKLNKLIEEFEQLMKGQIYASILNRVYDIKGIYAINLDEINFKLIQEYGLSSTISDDDNFIDKFLKQQIENSFNFIQKPPYAVRFKNKPNFTSTDFEEDNIESTAERTVVKEASETKPPQTGWSGLYDTPTDRKSEKSIPIYFVRYGDLLDSVMEILKDDSNIKEYKIIIGALKYYNSSENNIELLNLADIPISIDYFSAWFFNKVITKQRQSYYIKDFINDSLKDLIIPLLGYKFKTKIPVFANYSVNFSTITTSKKIETSNITDYEYGLLRDEIGSEGLYQYYIIHVDWVAPGLLNGDLLEDLNNGIYHMRIGQSSGILKSANFEKIDNKQLRSARMVGDQLNKAGEYLKEYYNVSIKTEGNPLLCNGGYFYLDAGYLGELGTASVEYLGLGGYYLVNGIELSIEPHKYEMNIKGFYQASEENVYRNIANSNTNKETPKPDMKKL